MRYIGCVFESRYCRLVFLLAATLLFFLMPREFFSGWTLPLALIFLFLSAVVITCIVRTIKERIVVARMTGAGFIAILGTALGLAALQVCGVGAPVCGASIGVALFSLFLPGVSLAALRSYAWTVLSASIILQAAALHFMRCFEEESGGRDSGSGKKRIRKRVKSIKGRKSYKEEKSNMKRSDKV